MWRNAPLLPEKRRYGLCLYLLNLLISLARAAVGWGSLGSALGFGQVACLQTLLTLLTLLFIYAEISERNFLNTLIPVVLFPRL